MRNHGTDPRTRMRLVQERIEAMKAIWTQDEASYKGEFVDFERIWSWPKPVQRPHPPVLVGGNGPTVLDRVLAFGDAWFPNYQRGADEIAARAGELRRRAERPIEMMVMGVPANATCSSKCGRSAADGSFIGSRREGCRRSSRRWRAGSWRSPSSRARRDDG